MTATTSRLAQLDGRLFLTDGGIETTLIFQDGFELPCFAAFPLLQTARGVDALRRYYTRHASIARDRGVGFVLESATWRASADWGARLGYSPRALEAVNRAAIELLRDVRPRARNRTVADGDQRLHRTARRRLPAGCRDDAGGGARVSRARRFAPSPRPAPISPPPSR